MDAIGKLFAPLRAIEFTRGRLALALAAALPFLASLAAHAIGSTPRVPAEGPSRPALAVHQHLVDLREVPNENYVAARFAFHNAGSEPLRVTALEPSCGCLNPRLEKRTYAPGEEGEFFIRVQTANEEPGPHEYFVDLKYEDPRPRVARVTMKVILPEQKIVIRPKALIFYQLGAGATTQEVVVTDYRPRGIEPLGVASTSPLAKAEIAGVDEDEAGHRRIRLRVTAADGVPPGLHRALIELRTDDELNSPLRIPLMIQRPEAPRTATPNAIPSGSIRR